MTPPRVALLTIGDGRDALLNETMASFRLLVHVGAPMPYVHVDDRAHRLGFAGAIREGWRKLRELPDPFDYIWHLEEDFTILRPVSIPAMAALLDAQPHLAQVALRRTPVAPSEHAAGGVVEQWPELYADRFLHVAADGTPDGYRMAWLEHELYFTTNPCLYRRALIEDHDWPDAPGSEAAFTQTMLGAGCRFALWGMREDGPWVEHTGTIRRGRGY